MQLTPEVTLMIGTAAGIVSIIASLYLIRIWRSYETRLLTDLPLLFGSALAFQGINTLMQTLVLAEVLPSTLEFLRIRAVVIGFIVFPIIPGLLNIWAFKYKRYHSRLLGGLIAYWFSVVLLAPSSSVLMTLLIPIMLIIMLGFIFTFAATWRTGRLKEVRSDLMLVSLLVILVSQAIRVPLYMAGLSVLSDIMNAFGTIVAALAFMLPTLKQSKGKMREPSVMAAPTSQY